MARYQEPQVPRFQGTTGIGSWAGLWRHPAGEGPGLRQLLRGVDGEEIPRHLKGANADPRFQEPQLLQLFRVLQGRGWQGGPPR
ncbi:MAG: hypothetical protein ACK559_08245, partial [bacterium]